MNLLNRIFNKDIREDIKKNILKYQSNLTAEAHNKTYGYARKHCRNAKNNKYPMPDLILSMEFDNLYFNFRLNELINNSEKIMSKDYVVLKKSWITDYVPKFWALQSKHEKELNMTQEEFDKLLKIGEVLPIGLLIEY